MSLEFSICDVFRTIPLRAVLSHSAEDTNEVTFFPFDILDAGFELAQLD